MCDTRFVVIRRTNIDDSTHSLGFIQLSVFDVVHAHFKIVSTVQRCLKFSHFDWFVCIAEIAIGDLQNCILFCFFCACQIDECTRCT